MTSKTRINLKPKPKPNPISEHVSRHLVAVSSAVRLRISRGLERRGHALSPSVSQLIPNLPEAGTGVSSLARRVGQSIQRTGQLVAQLESDGYVTRVKDPDDGRAKLVIYTRRGKGLLRDIAKLQEEITAEFTKTLGVTRFRSLQRDLGELDLALNQGDSGVRIVLRG
jgi:DNA-binding MarR family transcriptional regulator